MAALVNAVPSQPPAVAARSTRQVRLLNSSGEKYLDETTEK